MKWLKFATVFLLAGVVSVFAAINYNSSKSNTGNILVAPEVVTSAQAAAILADLEKSGKTPDEGEVRAAAAKHGVPKGLIKKVNITGITSGGGSKGYGITLLADPADEAAANAKMQKALPGVKGMKQGK
ncbi:MAG TPA: hypothetical protein VKS01_00710 [Bryobacteraceae bacterium]|nr:hypothetical protein [Bryobacteraceae bacterium]